MSIGVQGIGHAVVKVRDLRRAAGFYCGVLGMREVARRDCGSAATTAPRTVRTMPGR